MNRVNYIVYDTNTFEIIHASERYDRTTHLEIHKGVFTARTRPGRNYINTTHPKQQFIRRMINSVNDTNY